jgi:hypothetical protein
MSKNLIGISKKEYYELRAAQEILRVRREREESGKCPACGTRDSEIESKVKKRVYLDIFGDDK